MPPPVARFIQPISAKFPLHLGHDTSAVLTRHPPADFGTPSEDFPLHGTKKVVSSKLGHNDCFHNCFVPLTRKERAARNVVVMGEMPQDMHDVGSHLTKCVGNPRRNTASPLQCCELESTRKSAGHPRA